MYSELLLGIGIAIIIALFFLFRGISLWYWRINEMVNNQRASHSLLTDQNRILTRILLQLGGKLEHEGSTEISHPGKALANAESRIGQERSNTNQPTERQEDSDRDIVEQLKKKIKLDQVIVKVLQNGRIEVMKKSDWDEIVRLGNQDKFILLYS